MDDKSKIVFLKIGWGVRVERHLSLIDGLAECDVTFYRQAVEMGHKGLLGVFVNDERVGSIIWCLSDEPAGTVFVIDEMGAECRQGLDLVKATYDMAHFFAPKLGAVSLRFMTRRIGLLTKIKDQFETTYVMEKKL